MGVSDLPFELSDLPSEKVLDADEYRGTLPQVVAIGGKADDPTGAWPE
jgi:hypothetical protein